MTALLSSLFGVVVGLVMGAALQRWGDADRATHGHKDYPTVWMARPTIDGNGKPIPTGPDPGRRL